MGEAITLTAEDGFVLDAYRAEPPGQVRGGLVVIQEIFGVNGHIRGVADAFAADGYAVIAPALFDRAEKGVELGYAAADMDAGREIRARVGWDGPVRDIAAALAALGDAGKVGVLGYCWGGSLAWLTATRLNPACAICYYGGQIAENRAEQPNAPALMHFGETDASIPLGDVEAIRAAHPAIPIHVYPAGHGFNCEQRADYHRDSAALARTRTLEFLAQHVG